MADHTNEEGQAPYDNEFFDSHDEAAATSADVILGILGDYLKPASVVDVGCGTGQWLVEARRRFGADILGIDGEWNTTLTTADFEHRHADFESNFTIGRRFDLAVCLEVAEHLTPATADNLIDDLVASSDVVLFSGAVVEQPGVQHINCKRQSAWMADFTDRGYLCLDFLRPQIWDHPDVAWWYKQNIFLAVAPQSSIAHDERALNAAPMVPTDVIHPENYESSIRGHRRVAKDMWHRLEVAERKLGQPTGRDVAALGKTFGRRLIASTRGRLGNLSR